MTLDRIRALLSAPKLNIRAVAKETGISYTNLYRIRRGEDSINLGTLRKLETWAKGRRLPSEKQEGPADAA